MSICCNTCGMKVVSGKDKCDFAAVTKVVEGKEYTFCCAHCADDVKEE